MTILELAERDYRKAKINYLRAKQRPNTPPDELEHLEELRKLRYQMMEVVRDATHETQ